jgi:Fe-S oxidoreductase
MVNGSLVTGGWRASEVHEALDLCLSCKACSTECPAGVDMASYKSEVLHQSYRHRLRPRSHYALGQLPRWARLASSTPRIANLALRIPLASRAVTYAAGVDARRSLPRFATRSFRSWFAATAGERRVEGTPVVLLDDTFTNFFSPEVGIAAVRVLEDAGYSVSLPERRVCCALTWITTGQLDAARRIVSETVGVLEGPARAGVPIVGLEPSCTAAIRSDAARLDTSPAAAAVAAATRTLAELLAATPQWRPPSMEGVEVVAQPHCHHRAVMGWGADELLLRSTGAALQRIGGCCGLAGNFGVERGHYDVSVAVAENALLPAVRAKGKDAVVLADGFSCRTQLDDLAGERSVHLAQLLASRLEQ